MEFPCENIAFAAYLLSVGVPLLSRSQRGRKIIWVFDISPETLATAQEVWPLSPERRYFDNYLTLKTHLRER